MLAALNRFPGCMLRFTVCARSLDANRWRRIKMICAPLSASGAQFGNIDPNNEHADAP